MWLQIIMETQQAKQTLADIEARHADIIKLENSIRELHDMFMDMAMLVENQVRWTVRIVRSSEEAVEAVVPTLHAFIQKQLQYQIMTASHYIPLGQLLIWKFDKHLLTSVYVCIGNLFYSYHPLIMFSDSRIYMLLGPCFVVQCLLVMMSAG